MLGGCEAAHDNQLSAAAWAWQTEDPWRLIVVAFTFIACIFPALRLGTEQVSNPDDIGDPIAISEETVVADAMLAFGQDVDEEAADELVRLQDHGCVSASAVDAVVFDFEGHTVAIEPY